MVHPEGLSIEHLIISLGQVFVSVCRTFLTCDHVFDEITMTRSIYHSDVVFFSIEFLKTNINSDTTFSLSLQFVQNPGVFERTFAHVSSFLLKLFNGTFIDSTTLVNQMSSCC